MQELIENIHNLAVEPLFWQYIIVGFAAQLINGSIGMAYGVTTNTFLLSVGVPPKMASASVHTAKLAASLASGPAHMKFGNVNKRLCVRLLVPGLFGGIVGALLLGKAISGDSFRPYIAGYLLLMGVVILAKAFGKIKKRKLGKKMTPLAFAGGCFDAIGGGGWGPIVTSTLLANGYDPRQTIGSVSLAEFFVTIAQVLVFLMVIENWNWGVILGLMIGGVIAAPVSAYLCRKLKPRLMMIAVGMIIILLSLKTITMSFIFD